MVMNTADTECEECETEERSKLMAEIALHSMNGDKGLSLQEVRNISGKAADWMESKGYKEMFPALFRALDKQKILLKAL